MFMNAQSEIIIRKVFQKFNIKPSVIIRKRFVFEEVSFKTFDSNILTPYERYLCRINITPLSVSFHYLCVDCTRPFS
eukprot:UN18585